METITAPKTGRSSESQSRGFESHVIRDTATVLGQKVEDAACAVTCKADEAAAAAARGIESVAGQIRSHMPEGGMMGAASTKLAESLEYGGRYLKEQGVTGMTDDVTTLIRRNPITALCVGVGFGFLLARATTCRNI